MYEKRPKNVCEWLTSFNMYDRIKENPILPPANIQSQFRLIINRPKMVFHSQTWNEWNLYYQLGERAIS